MKATPQINFDPSDWDGMEKIREQYGETQFPFHGENEEGETVAISVFPDKIVVETYQNNGWARKNIYWEDGTVEELWNGRWRF